MTGRVGEITGQELWVRCPHCGDSAHNLNKAHLSINISSGLYHCYRCKASGKLSPKEQAKLSLFRQGLGDVTEQDLFDPGELIPGPAGTRKSLLPRFHVTWREKTYDAFEMYNPKSPGEIAGIHLRGVGETKESFSSGSGLGWPKQPRTLLSDSEHPLRLVEGPYDVLYPEDVCCYGIITQKKVVEFLRGHYVILCPDGDVWTKKDLFDQFTGFISRYLKYNKAVRILGIEYIPDGLDPDDVEKEDRQLIGIKELMNNIRKAA